MPDTVEHWVLHVDLDQFLAAVEVLRRPELAGLPVVVGGRGDPTERGVVSTASYEARAFGIGSGMPLRVAARRCPDAVFLPVDRPAYDAASAEVMATLRALEWDGRPVVVEVLGWDEAFLAVAPQAGAEGTAGPTPVVEAGQGSLPPVIPEGKGALGGLRRGHGTDPRAFAARVRERVLAATGLHCSVGIGDNLLRAKIATEFGKPRGSFVLTEDNWSEVMGGRPTRALWGVGPRTAKKLAALGIDTVEQLAGSDVRLLAAELGPTMGPHYHRLGRGIGSTVVTGEAYVPRAHGRETTFQTDLEDWEQVAQEVRTLTERVLADVDAEGRPAARVGLKVRYRPFSTVTRSLTLPEPTTELATLQDAAVGLLDRVERDRPVRLLGVRLEMVPPPGGY